MRRREFIAGLGAAAWPVVARAQQPERVRRIGVLMSFVENDPVGKPFIPAFTQALADLGWTVGRNVRIDVRWGGSDINLIQAFAQELVGLQPDIIVTVGTPATAAVQQERGRSRSSLRGWATPSPAASSRGSTFEASLGGKWLELLLEIAPGLKRATIMFNPDIGPASAYMPSQPLHPHWPRRNLHRACGTVTPHITRVPSLKAFGRRPPVIVDALVMGPSSETLHKSRLSHCKKDRDTFASEAQTCNPDRYSLFAPQLKR
jgi:hypothetical protein